MGCILYEMCARRVPFDAPDLKSLIHRITKEPAPEIPSDYSVPTRQLGKELLDRDPLKRPPAAEILKRPVVQEMVRRMLDEVKGEEETAAEKAGGSAASAAAPTRSASGSGAGHAGHYTQGEAVDYYSETHKEWLGATVTAVDADGRIQLNVKPNVWLSLEIQAAKVRPRGGGASSAVVAAAAARPSSISRPPPAASSPSRGQKPPDRRDGGMARNPSRDALARQPTPGRVSSPRRDLGAGVRGASPGGRRLAPAAPQRAASPYRNAAAGVPSARG